ncbi:MAG TPA: hypothetical protein VGP72_33595 [Planctomycetota bacterium]|jgi:hypothetical protein
MESGAEKATPLASESAAINVGSTSTLDAATSALCAQAVQHFRGGLTQALLYSEGTKQFERALESCLKALTDVMQAIGPFKFGVAETRLLINSERVETPNWLRGHLEQLEKFFHASGVGSLMFEKSLAREELGPFLHLMARRKIPDVESTKINEFLREQGILHIQVDRLRYARLRGEEKIVSGDSPVLAHHAVAQKNLGELVNATLAVIDKVGDSEAKAQLRSELADQLIEKNESMLDNMLHTASPRVKDACSDARASLMTVPSRDGPLLQHALDLAMTLRKQGFRPDDEAVKSVSGLIAELVAPYQTHAEDILSVAKKLDTETLTLLPEWLANAHAALQGGSAAERLGGILCLSPGALIDELMYAQITDILDELCVAGMDTQAEQLASHVAGALKTPTKHERVKAVQRLSFLAERALEQSSLAVRTLEDSLLTACSHETCDEVMKLLLDHLSGRCVRHYKLGNFQRAREHLDWIVGLETTSRSALKDEGANIARLAREQLSKTEFAASLPADLLNGGEQAETALQFIKALGPPAWAPVIAQLRTLAGAPAERMASLLKEIHPHASQLFYTELGREENGPTALRMLKLADIVGDETALWAQMQALLRHQDESVRDYALAMVMSKDGAPAVQTLSTVLQQDQNPQRQRLWMGALARLRDPNGQELLLAELEHAATLPDADGALVVALLETLSSVANAGVIPPAVTLCGPGEPRRSRAVILAALKALAPFYADPSAAAALERARKDKDAEIARLALVCLRGIVAAEQQAQQLLQPAAKPLPEKPSAQTAAAIAKKTVVVPRPWFEEATGPSIGDVFQAGAAIGSKAPPASPQVAKDVETAARSETSTKDVETPRRVEAVADSERSPADAEHRNAPPSEAQPSEPNRDRKGSADFLKPITRARTVSRIQRRNDDEEEDTSSGPKPTLEGRLHDLGLDTTLRMVGGKDGLLKIKGPDGEGLIHVRGRKVVRARYGSYSDIDALDAIDRLQMADFAYFARPVPADGAALDLEIAKLSEKLKAHRRR